MAPSYEPCSPPSDPPHMAAVLHREIVLKTCHRCNDKTYGVCYRFALEQQGWQIRGSFSEHHRGTPHYMLGRLCPMLCASRSLWKSVETWEDLQVERYPEESPPICSVASPRHVSPSQGWGDWAPKLLSTTVPLAKPHSPPSPAHRASVLAAGNRAHPCLHAQGSGTPAGRLQAGQAAT